MNFAPNVTPRYIAKYKSAGFDHNVMIRVARGTDVAAGSSIARSALAAVFGALASLLPEDFAWLSAAYCLEDTDVFYPGFTVPTTVTGLKALADYTPMMRATDTMFKGSGGGSKTGLSAFGVFWDPSDVAGPAANGKVNGTESVPVANAIAALNAASGIRSIANSPASWYGFATVKPNDHFVGLARRLFS